MAERYKNRYRTASVRARWWDYNRNGIYFVTICTSGQDETILPGKGGFSGQNNPMLHSNLARIIRWYKARVAYFARKEQASFAWQPRYHDTIIRDPESLNRIRQYIVNNPSKYRQCRD